VEYGFGRDEDLFELDFDDLNVTVTMVPVAKRAERVFLAGEDEWPAVQRMYRQFAAEMGFDLGTPSLGNSGEVWLVTAPKILRNYSLVCGAVEIATTASGTVVDWMWVHPMQRGGGRRGPAWLLWSKVADKYGTVGLNPPVSRAMRRFVENFEQSAHTS
jgi:hypothetical protein